MLRNWIFTLFFCLFLAIPLWADPELPSITATYFKNAPVVDGKLDDSCWKEAAKVSDFKITGKNQPAKGQTTAYLGYTEKNLYVAFECQEPEMEKALCQFKQDDIHLWLDDVVEVFLSPYSVGDSKNYWHFGVNMAGARATLNGEHSRDDVKWRAATSKIGDKWFAEIEIPFSVIKPAGKNEEYWRVNFCRGRAGADEFSSWSPVPSQFDSYWCFGKLYQPKEGPHFISYVGPIIPAKPQVKQESLKTLPSAVKEIARPEIPIIPAPQKLTYTKGNFTISPKTILVVGDHISAMDRRAAEEVNQEIRKKLGFTLQILPASQAKGKANRIVIGEPSINSSSKKLCLELKQVVTSKSPGEEGYVLVSTPETILIAGSDQLGTFWGAETLRQMIQGNSTGKGTVRCSVIRDWPRFHYRAVHLLSSPDAAEFHTKCIEELFSRMKINNITLEAQNVRWDSHPEIFNSSRGMSKDDVRKIIQVANAHHIKVTPLIESLGHMQWAFYGNHHLDFAEDPQHPYAFCPLNEKAYQFMFDIMDEAIDLFNHPEYLNIGHDEIFNPGRFPFHEECKKIGAVQLYYNDTLRYYNFLKSKGVKTMMWGDILLQNDFKKELHQLPKDLVICDWHYGGAKEYPSLKVFKDAGLPIIACTWYNPANLYYFSKEAEKNDITGMMQTTWTGYLPSSEAFKNEYQQIYAYILGGEWSWTPDKPTLDKLGYDPEIVFDNIWGSNFTPVKNHLLKAIPLTNYSNISYIGSSIGNGWLGLGPGEDVSKIPVGAVRLGGIPFFIADGRKEAGAVLLRGPECTREFPEMVSGILVGTKAITLHFLQAAGWEAPQGQPVGKYIIHYADGSTQIINLVYGTHLRAWDDPYSTSRDNRYAWSGKTASGNRIAVRSYSWANPKPDVLITSIDFQGVGSQASPILFAITAETEK